MTDELLAYLMDDLSAGRRAEVERNLAIDPAWRRELERLQQCLAANAEPEIGSNELPCDLVKRTCTLVEHVGDCRGGVGTHRGTGSSAGKTGVGSAVCVGASHRWSFVDMSVGGGAILLVGFLLLPALVESREASRGAACQSNLQWLGSRVFEFQDRFDRLLPSAEPGEHAGAYTTKLVELGGVDRGELSQRVLCPNSVLAEMVCSGRVMLMIPTLAELEKAHGEARLKLVQLADGVYAIRMGHFDTRDLYHLPEFTGCSKRPMMADAPDSMRPGVSNHPGGQYVLDESLSTDLFADSYLGEGDDIYRNDAGHAAAGCDSEDIVLGGGVISPMGPFVSPVKLIRGR